MGAGLPGSLLRAATKRGLRHIRNRPRLMLSVAVFLVLFFGLSREWHWTLSILCAFDLAAALFLGLTLRAFADPSLETMRQRARVEDEGKWTVLALSSVVALVVLVALIWSFIVQRSARQPASCWRPPASCCPGFFLP